MVQKLLHYDVLEKLGEGAASVIYKVRDPATKQVYALKHVVRGGAVDLRFFKQMESEYEVSRHFNHENLRRTIELKVVKKFFFRVSEAFLVMEYVEGTPLDKRLMRSPYETVDTFAKAARGLASMHAQGYVHCDIKPNNILRDDHGNVKVIDFGQSCRIGTVKERIQGTPDYISPEQVKRRPVTPKTDIFNLGASLYWVLTGKPIPTLYTMEKKDNSFLVDDRIPSPADIKKTVPAPLSKLTMDCVALLPEKRPADMETLIHRLEVVGHLLLKEMDPAAVERAKAKVARELGEEGN